MYDGDCDVVLYVCVMCVLCECDVFVIVLCVIVVFCVFGVIVNVMMFDCDEVFNYWELLYVFMYGYGL